MTSHGQRYLRQLFPSAGNLAPSLLHQGVLVSVASGRQVDQATVKALGLKAPPHRLWMLRCYTVRYVVLGGKIFDNFTKRERRAIWDRLQKFYSVNPIFIGYLNACADRVKPNTAGVYCNRRRKFLAQIRVHSCSTDQADRVDLGYRRLFA